MQNNIIFSFGDMMLKQLNGTAMGAPSAPPPPPPPPPYATFYYGLHESKFLPNHRQHVIFYKRFIDDVSGIWVTHPNPQINMRLWDKSTKSMNNYPGLTCEFNAPSDKVDFMDLTISIKNGQISTSLFEKPLNLHLYIPPYSDHPPGLLPGIVHSTLFQFCTLGSDPNDQILRMKVFLNGYRHEVTRATKLNLSFLKELPVLKVTLDHPTQQTMSTQRSYSPYHSIPMTHHHTKFNRHVATQSHPPNTICPCLTFATQN